MTIVGTVLNRFVFDCAKKSKRHSLISEQFLVLIGIGLVTSLIADFVWENGDSSCGDASEEKKFHSAVSCWTLFLCQFFHSLVLCLTSCKADRFQTTTYPVLRTRDSAMLFCPVPDATT